MAGSALEVDAAGSSNIGRFGDDFRAVSRTVQFVHHGVTGAVREADNIKQKMIKQ